MGLKPLIELLKVPVPEPSLVLVFKSMVGPGVVLQQTPRCVMVPPPSDVISPPEIAVLGPLIVTESVVITGISKLTSGISGSFLHVTNDNANRARKEIYLVVLMD